MPAAAADLDLVALICSKLCHDLAGSIGAVSNGAELMAEETDPQMRDEAVRLIAQSANDAARRLAFFRLALGASGDLMDAMPGSELQRVAIDYFAGGRVAFEPPSLGVLPGDLPKPLGKALLLGLLGMAGALPRGGRLRLIAETDSWRILAEPTAPNATAKLPEALRSGLDSAGPMPTEPNAALARHARDLAALAGFGAGLSQSSDTTAELLFQRAL
ncbi:histidine phosphotransferase family protein [Ferrovibrio sp.]|uniref:histidine phosphotransferase family protein n=1 Tax=Ferrovibrio sp. TaxID=1917215 RepID=UPI0035B21118